MKDLGKARALRRDGGAALPVPDAFFRRGAQVRRPPRSAIARAAGHLHHTDPLASAALGLTRPQRAALLGAATYLAGLTLLAPHAMAVMLHHFLWLFFAASILFRAIVLVLAVTTAPPKPPRPGARLPVYTILIPLYQESAVLDDLFAAISALNYPKHKLDIKLLLEAGDRQTISAATALQAGAHWEIILAAKLGPTTKPKALNAGLARARGELVTIFDAEDRPHPDQLLHAAHAFAQDGDGRLGCVQAPLGYYNAGRNWLTRQFALEYAAHFHVLLPAMTRLGLPFPLGGTSNHFRRSALKQVHGWDPYNVTEDADLGYRLSAKGWRLGVIAPPTMEEAVSRLRPWKRQRSRWLKGYLQTLGVHMRRPAGCNALAGAFSMAMTLGTSVFAALGHASFSILIAAGLLLSPWTGMMLRPADMALALAGFAIGGALLHAGGQRAGVRFTVWDILGAVLYWPLQSWAMTKAVHDLFKRPFHWEKTQHGQ